MSLPPDFSIGDWTVAPSRNRIRRRADGLSRTIEPLLMRLLCALAARDGETVTKDDLVQEAWNGVIVSDEAVSQAVSRLRRALSDDPQHPRYIETVRSRGYRLTTPVSPAPANAIQRVSGRTAVTATAAGAIALVVIASLLIFRPFRDRDLAPIARDLRDERNAAVSPDGRQIAYEVVEADGATTLWISDLEDPQPARVVGSEGARAPAWLSNRTLAMQTGEGEACQIVSLRFGDPAMQHLGGCVGSAYADLAASPDGLRLAYNAHGYVVGGARAIHVLEVGGGARRVTTPPPDSWGDYDPVFSPDGRSLLFVRAASEGQQDLYLVTAEGRERRLTRTFGNIFGATWIGSSRVAFASRTGGRYALRVLDVASRSDRPLALPVGDVVNPAFRAGELTVEARRFETRLVLMQGGEPRAALANASGVNLHPALSRDGRLMAFMSDRSGSYELWLLDQASGRLRQLTRHRGPFVGSPGITPDGLRIVYEVRTGDDSDIRVLDITTGRSRQLVDGGHFDTAPSVSADGSRVYFASDRGEGWNVYAAPLSGGGEAVLVAPGAFAAIEDPAGGHLYFTRRERPGLYRRDLRTGQTTVVSQQFAPHDWGGFAPVRGGVVLLDRQRNAFVMIDRDGQRRVVATPGGRIPAHDPVVSATPDLGQVVYAETGPGTGDIYRVSGW